MESYFEQGTSRKDCELKIAEKYKRPFHILNEREIKFGGFLGFGRKSGVQVEFYFTPVHSRPVPYGYQSMSPVSWFTHDGVGSNRQQAASLQATAAYPTDLEEEKRKVLAAAGKNYDEIAKGGIDASKQILDSLNELKEKIETGVKKEEHPAFTHAAQLLKANDFSESYIQKMQERLRKELSWEKLDDMDYVQDRLLEWIGESISIYNEDELRRRPEIMVLIGPTGVGKTTTVAKLAAIFGIGTDEIKAVNVRMITIDAFRIGAKEQLLSYGDIMRINVSCVDNKQALRKEIALYSEDTDLFLIDTIGKSPKDMSRLGEMKEILEGAGRTAVFHLVIDASKKASDIEDIIRQFEPFNFKSVLLTKMDETDRIGNVISALDEKKKPVSYITDGQKVPNDIRKATVLRFLIKLDGFKADRERIENRFPSGKAEQFKWS